MKRLGDGRLPSGLPWMPWVAVMLAAFGLKLFYSRASVEDLAWILAPTARAVGWLRGEALIASGAGWMAPDASYVIAPACAGVNFLILVLTVSVLGFIHRLPSARQRLAWWLGSLFGAWLVTIAVNTARILAAVELYRHDFTVITPGQAHRLLGTVLYLGALWGVFGMLDGLTARRHNSYSRLAAAVLIPAAYLGMTVVVPLLTGGFRESAGRYAEHAMMVGLVTLASAGALLILARRAATRRTP